MRLTVCGDGDEMFHKQMAFFELSAVCCAEYCVCWSNVDNVLGKHNHFSQCICWWMCGLLCVDWLKCLYRWVPSTIWHFGIVQCVPKLI